MAITAYELRDILNGYEAALVADDLSGDSTRNVWTAILWDLLPAIPDTTDQFNYDGMTFRYDYQRQRWDYVTAETPQEG